MYDEDKAMRAETAEAQVVTLAIEVIRLFKWLDYMEKTLGIEEEKKAEAASSLSYQVLVSRLGASIDALGNSITTRRERILKEVCRLRDLVG